MKVNSDLLRFYWRATRSRWRDHRAETAALLAAIRDGDTALDVGANKGSFLLWLSRAVGSGRVHAFEPQPLLADYLTRIAADAGLRNVTVHQLAVSDRKGKATLLVPGGGPTSPGAHLSESAGGGQGGRAVEVTRATLDELFPTETRVSGIKVDVEGHELAVFKGAEALIDRCSPLLVFECENRHLRGGRVEDVLEWLALRGYDGHFVERRSLVPIDRFDAGRHQVEEGHRFWERREYCNNFIMSREGGAGSR